jgi:hypothetical protein
MQSLREDVLGLDDSISEELQYGGILFAVGNKAFCGIFSYSRHVSLEFGEGALLPDKYKVLEGEGKSAVTSSSCHKKTSRPSMSGNILRWHSTQPFNHEPQ